MFDAGEPTGHAEGAAVPVPSAPNIVAVRDFTVTLYPRPSLALGIGAAVVFGQGGGLAVIQGALAELYLRHGIASWTARDAKGNTEPITPENVERLLPYEDGGLEVFEAADALYGAVLLAPFIRRQQRSSEHGPADESMSPTPSSGETPRKLSRRSSRSTSEDGKPSGDPAP